MAFGSLRGTLTGSSTSPGTGFSATGSVSVTKGDLIVVNMGWRGATQRLTFTDNLGNGYIRLGDNQSATGSNAGIYAAWAYAKANGTLTSVTVAIPSSTTADAAIAVTVIEGVFDPWCHDVDTLSIADSSSPYTCPASGTLTQADEVIFGLQAQGNGGAAASYAAGTNYTIGGTASSGTGSNTASAAAVFRLVSSTSSDTPSLTSSASTSGGTKTVSFRKQRTAATGDCIGQFALHSGGTSVPGFATVAADDLIVVQTFAGSGVTPSGDSLGNSYTGSSSGSDGLFTAKFSYSIVTAAGDCTSITIPSTDPCITVAAAFKGPVTALDIASSYATDAAAPFQCPASGTLAQADELVIGAATHRNGVATIADATAPGVMAGAATSEGVSGLLSALQFRVVTSTASVTPAFGDAGNFGTFTFKITPTAAPKLGEARFEGAGNFSANVTSRMVAAATYGGLGDLRIDADLRMVAAATFGGAGNLSVDATIVTAGVAHQGEARFAGAGSLSALALTIKYAEATFAGAGSLSAAAITYKFGEARFEGAGNLSVAATLGQGARAIFAGAGSLSIDARLNQAISAIFAGAGSLSADAVKAGQVQQAEAIFAGAGALSISVQTVKLGAATFTGAGSLSVAAQTIKFADARFQGAGSLSALANQTMVASAIMPGLGSLSIDAKATLPIAITFAGAGALSALARIRTTGEATFAGAGALSISARMNMTAAALFGGTGALSVSAVVTGQANAWPGEARFTGSGSLSIATRQTMQAAARFQGGGELSVLATGRFLAAATFQGAGAFSANTQPILKLAAATFAGAGNVSVQVRINAAAFATFAGASSFSAATTARLAAAATFAGAGTLQADSATVSTIKFASIIFAGAGGMSVATNARMVAAANFNGAGALSVIMTGGVEPRRPTQRRSQTRISDIQRPDISDDRRPQPQRIRRLPNTG